MSKNTNKPFFKNIACQLSVDISGTKIDQAMRSSQKEAEGFQLSNSIKQDGSYCEENREKKYNLATENCYKCPNIRIKDEIKVQPQANGLGYVSAYDMYMTII